MKIEDKGFSTIRQLPPPAEAAATAARSADLPAAAAVESSQGIYRGGDEFALASGLDGMSCGTESQAKNGGISGDPAAGTDGGTASVSPWGASETTEATAVGGGTPLADRPDLDQVLRDYQVEAEPTTAWRPSALGLIPVPFIGEHELTQTEAQMLDGLSVSRGLLGLKEFSDIKDQAFDVSEERYPAPAEIPDYVQEGDRGNWPTNDGHCDAFRHAYWNALLTQEFGAEWAAQYATAHEALDGNQAPREAMDLWNNEVGRQIAIDHPNASPEELADLVQQAVENGQLTVIDQSGGLAWSDQVALHQHGVAADTTLPGAIPVPDGNASARF